MAAFMSRIHCEHHAETAVVEGSVCTLAALEPDRLCLIRKRSKRTVSSIMGKLFQVNAYIFNNEFPSGKVVVSSIRCNRDTMWYENISESRRCEI
jgi:hypothetical protein